MIPHALLARYLLRVLARTLICFRPLMRPLAIEGIARLAVRESSNFAVQLSNGARQSQLLLPAAKRSSGIWARQAEKIAEMNVAAARSRIRTRLIVGASLIQYLVAWNWPWEDGLFGPYDDEVEVQGSGLTSLFEERRQSWVRMRAPSLRTEELAVHQITLPSMPCRWRHCCECVHLGPAWCSRGHGDGDKSGLQKLSLNL